MAVERSANSSTPLCAADSVSHVGGVRFAALPTAVLADLTGLADPAEPKEPAEPADPRCPLYLPLYTPSYSTDAVDPVGTYDVVD